MWGREVSYGSGVLVGGLDAILSDQEPGELYLPPPEFLCVEHQTVLVTVGQNAAYPLEGPSTVSEWVMMWSPIFSKSLSDVVDGQSSMMVSVCLL